MIADRLAAERPHHRFLGEEFGTAGDPSSPWRWIVDPIDGTSGYVRGIPVWATLIALEHGADGVVVAVVSAPALGRRWWASAGGGCFADGRPCRVSTVDAIADAQVSVTLNDGWDDLGLTPALVGLAQEARRARGFGDFWQHCLVAEGALDVAVDAVGVAPYDIAAVRLLVEEAGGTFTDRHGAVTHESDTAISTQRACCTPRSSAASAADRRRRTTHAAQPAMMGWSTSLEGVTVVVAVTVTANVLVTDLVESTTVLTRDGRGGRRGAAPAT